MRFLRLQEKEKRERGVTKPEAGGYGNNARSVLVHVFRPSLNDIGFHDLNISYSMEYLSSSDPIRNVYENQVI
jgi:hypothetical protein